MITFTEKNISSLSGELNPSYGSHKVRSRNKQCSLGESPDNFISLTPLNNLGGVAVYHPFFTSVLKIPIKTTIYYCSKGKRKMWFHFLSLKKLRKKQMIKDWRKTSLSQIPYFICRQTFIKRTLLVIKEGLAYEKDGNLYLKSLDKSVTEEGEKFIRVLNDSHLIKRIQLEVLKKQLRAQERRILSQQEENQVTGSELPVTHKIGDKYVTTTTNPNALPNHSCIGIAKLFGYSSSYSGWLILKNCAPLVTVTKRFIDLDAPYSSNNSTYIGKPIQFVKGRAMRPIASIIEVKMQRAKKGIVGLNIPKYKTERLINSYYNDIID